MRLRFRSADATTDLTTTPIARIVADVCFGTQQSALDNYLNEVSARLHGIPKRHRADICRELRQHLESSIAARGTLGEAADTAIEAAIQQFGEPEMIARRFCKAWQSTFPVENPWISMRRALGIICVATALLIPLESVDGLFVHSPDDPRIGVIAIISVLPALAGACFAWMSPRRSIRGNVYALAALAIVTSPFVVLQTWSGPPLGLYIDIFHVLCTILGRIFTIWLPIGIIAAIVATVVKDRREMQIARG